MKNRKMLVLVGTLIAGLSLIGGVWLLVGTMVIQTLKANLPTPTPLMARLRAAQITLADLPAGWQRTGEYSEDIPDSLLAAILVYSGIQDKDWMKTSHELILYPNEESAETAYQEEISTFGPGWVSLPGLTFEGKADSVYIACVPGYINGIAHYACEAVGLYEDTLSILRADVFEEQWMTMVDYEAALAAMDRRVAESLKLRD
ncbi:MAG: hypothetical protein JXA33_27005 [Anaerolineae bacterium]|nr:hypothetical protein [Anaerolineae bacterium]